MRKTNVIKILKISLLLFIISLIYSIKVQASEASLSVSNTSGSKEFTVTINIPSDIAGYDGTISITYSDGTSKNLSNITPSPKLDENNNFSYIGNYTRKFTAEKTGQAVVTVSNFKMYSIDNSNANNLSPVNTITSLAQTVNITDKASTPKPSTTSETPNNNQAPKENPTPVVLNFKENNEKMYTTRRVNVRQSYGTENPIIQTLSEGVEVTRTGISDGTKNGYSWSRISYNGITGYIITSALTYEEPTKVEEEPEESPEEVEEETPEEDKNEIEKIAESLGAIPEVGLNIMPFLFMGSVVSCIVLMFDVKKRINK